MAGSPLPFHNPPPRFCSGSDSHSHEIVPSEDSSCHLLPPARACWMQPRRAIIPTAAVGLLLMIPAGLCGGYDSWGYYRGNIELPLVGIAPIFCSMAVQIAAAMARHWGKKVPLWLTLSLDILISAGLLTVLVFCFLVMRPGFWTVYATVPMLMLCCIHFVAAGQDAGRAFREWIHSQGGGFFRVGDPAAVGDVRVVCVECGRHGTARDAEFGGQEDAVPVQVGVGDVETGGSGVVL